MNKQVLIIPLACAMAATVNLAFAKEVNLELQLKNLYAERNLNDPTKPSIGSWIQDFITRAEGEHTLTEILRLHLRGRYSTQNV